MFAVGDVHGYCSELELILRWMEHDQMLGSDDLVIFIGDYIDRGKDSRGVVDRLIDFKSRFPDTVFLRGNHEDMLLGFLGMGGSHGDVFITNGGKATLRSYGLDEWATPSQLLSAMPQSHIDFFSSLELAVRCGGYLFVHAGINPRFSLFEQVADDLLWIREEFFSCRHSLNLTVVFGHTPFADVFFELPYRVGIDTGIAYGNKLSCVELTQGIVASVPKEGKAVITTQNDHSTF
ncbi:MAG: serine/threonine protein phosphatase [Candidatus Dadabacteria bacterium]|nr:MAG: serine/threonine protein phosphatase [Candidatus Dadabacteria bacterium]